MFSAEGLWGKTRPLARNRSHPAATMIKSCADIEVAQQAKSKLFGQGCDVFKTVPPETWAVEAAVLNMKVKCSPLGRAIYGVLPQQGGG